MNLKLNILNIGFCNILAIIFITLKLIGKITWSWWWVLSPLWIPFSIVFILSIFYVLIIIIEGID